MDMGTEENESTPGIICQYAASKKETLKLEEKLGFKGLTSNERRILYAIADIICASPETSSAVTSEIKMHNACKRISYPTFSRALRRLTEDGFLTKESGQSVRDHRYTILV